MAEQSRAKQMALILKKQGKKEPSVELRVREPKPGIALKKLFKADKEQKEPLQLRGILYRKFFRKNEPEKRAFGRIGEALELLGRKPRTEYPKFQVFPQTRLTVIAPVKELKFKSTIYPLIKPYAYARIRMDTNDNSFVYDVVEPQLNEYENHVFEKIKEGLIQVINVSFEDIRKHSKMVDFLEDNVRKLLEEYDFVIDDREYLKIMYYVFRDFIGLNKIEPLLRDPYIEDIGVDGTNLPIFVVHQRYGSIKTSIIYTNETELKEFVTKLAERCDRYISYAEPLLDGSLPDGTRINASLASDVTTRGPTFSIRKFKEEPFTPVDMVRLNTASPEMLAYMWYVVENGANILITGGVATGKTSMLNTLSLFIPPEKKIVSIEDTREISLPHENWIPGVARVGFAGSEVGEVTMFDLLKESFRQNPDYLIVGEIRGKEAYIMFQAMASGHPSISTMHAGSVDDVMKRLRTEPINLSPGLLETLDLVIVMVHAMGKGKSSRRVKEIIEIESVDKDTGAPRISKAFVWVPSVDEFEYYGESWLLHKIATEKGITTSDAVKEISRRKRFIEWLMENNIQQLGEVVEHITKYYRNPEFIEDVLDNKAINADQASIVQPDSL